MNYFFLGAANGTTCLNLHPWELALGFEIFLLFLGTILESTEREKFAFFDFLLFLLGATWMKPRYISFPLNNEGIYIHIHVYIYIYVSNWNVYFLQILFA